MFKFLLRCIKKTKHHRRVFPKNLIYVVTMSLTIQTCHRFCFCCLPPTLYKIAGLGDVLVQYSQAFSFLLISTVLRNSATTTRGPPSPPGKSRLLSSSFCQVSLPSTPSLREPRPSPSTPATSKLCSPFNNRPDPNGPFQGHQNFQTEIIPVFYPTYDSDTLDFRFY